MKTIGLVGGMGWEASATYYRVMNREVRARLGGWHSARVLLDSLDFHSIATAREPRDFDAARDLLVESAQRLEVAGAQALVLACNTVHRFAAAVQSATSVPLLHIADAAGAALVADGHRRVGLLGTTATLRGGFYDRVLSHHHGLEVCVPSPPSRDALHSLILNELAAGTEPEACARRIDALVEELSRDGCTAVLLACTELGLAYGSPDAPVLQRHLPLYDSAVIHALAAVDFALG